MLQVINASSDGGELSQAKIERMIRESYYEVSAYVVSYFNEKCKLALQNCLFQTQWEKVFGKERLSTDHHHNQHNHKHHHDTGSKSKRFLLQKSPAATITTTVAIVSNSLHNNNSYYYCQPYLIGKFCIDDYLIKSNDYAQCFNLTGGNSPAQFRKAIYRERCKFYYSHFFESHSVSILYDLKTRNSIHFILFYLLSYFASIRFLLIY